MKKFSGILILAILLATVATILALRQHDDTSLPKDGVLVGAFESQLTRLDQIDIQKAQGMDFSVQLVNGHWQVKDSSQYPVDQTKLEKILKNLAAAHKLQPKTSKKAYYNRLGLTDIADQDSQATLLTLHAGKQHWSVLVGKTAIGGQGQYVRLPKQAQSWLIDQKLHVPLSEHDWLQQPVLPAELTHIKQLVRTDDNHWTIYKVKPDQGEFLLKPLPDGKNLKYSAILDGPVKGVADLQFDSKQRFDDKLWSSFKPDASFSIETFSGKTLQLQLASQGDKHYARFTSSDASGYWQKWIYQISAFSLQQVNKKLGDFIQPDKPEQAIPTAAKDEGEAPK